MNVESSINSYNNNNNRNTKSNSKNNNNNPHPFDFESTIPKYHFFTIWSRALKMTWQFGCEEKTIQNHWIAILNSVFTVQNQLIAKMREEEEAENKKHNSILPKQPSLSVVRDEMKETKIDETDAKFDQNVIMSKTDSCKVDHCYFNPKNYTIMTNPYVILVGIEDYSKSKPKMINLDGVGVDIKTMLNLWSSVYGYKDLEIGFKPLQSGDKASNKHKDIKQFDSKCIDSNQEFSDWLINSPTNLSFYKRNDGLIFYFLVMVLKIVLY